MTRLAIVNGPNLGRLGRRQPEIYGRMSWDEFEAHLRRQFSGVEFEIFQSNHEGEILDFIERAADNGVAGLVINPGALTHQSYALRDCLAALSIPVLEVHLSNIYAREAFRAHSLTAPVVKGQISGLGLLGYKVAVMALIDLTAGKEGAS